MPRYRHFCAWANTFHMEGVEEPITLPSGGEADFPIEQDHPYLQLVVPAERSEKPTGKRRKGDTVPVPPVFTQPVDGDHMPTGTPFISGTVVQDGTVTVYLDDTVAGSGPSLTGEWFIAIAAPEGVHKLSACVTVGNLTSAWAPDITVTFDPPAPPEPEPTPEPAAGEDDPNTDDGSAPTQE